MKGLDGRVAVVTGGASGIGYTIVERLLESNVKVAIGDLNEERLKEIENNYTDQVVGVVTNVTSEEDIKKLVTTAVEKFDKLDYGINVAGMGKSGLIMGASLDDWKVTIVLVLHVILLSVNYEALAMNVPDSAIVNIASLNSHVSMFFGGAYAFAKAGIEMLTQNAAFELAKYG